MPTAAFQRGWAQVLLVGTALTAAPMGVSAYGPATSVEPIRVNAELPEPDIARLDEALRDGLTRAGFDLEAAEVPSSSVRATITRKDADFEVELAAEGPGGEAISVTDACELCGITELSDLLGGLAARLRQKFDAMEAPALLIAQSQPAGAEAFLDGEAVGTAPVELEVAPGRHTLEFRLAGFQPASREVEIEAGERNAYSVTMVRVRYREWLPWTLLATGLAGAAGGAVLLVLHDRPIERDCNEDREGNCQYLHVTQTPGIVLMSVGGALAVTGVALAIAWRSKAPSARARARLRPTAQGLSLRF